MNQSKAQPINLDKAEFILSLSSQKNGFKSMMALLREIEDQLQARQKENKLFYKVSLIIEHGYSKKMHANQHMVKRIQHEAQKQEKEIEELYQRRTLLKQELSAYEEELSRIRDYAEQRRNKKSKRERQYHQLYHVPILATQFKKKYVRARDKNSDAEEQVSHMRSNVDTRQEDISQISKSITDLQKRREQSLQQCKEVESELKKDQELLFQLQEGRKFICGFDQYQWTTAQKATAQFVESVQSCFATNQPQKLRDPHQHFVKVFKMALFEYGEAETFADQRWGSIKVPYNCAKCKELHMGWPKLDKVRKSEFICDACYQEHHTDMVIEKKLNDIKHKSQQLLTLPGGSMLSFSSTSTVQSEGQPGFKKMMKKMLKKSNETSKKMIPQPIMMAQ